MSDRASQCMSVEVCSSRQHQACPFMRLSGLVSTNGTQLLYGHHPNGHPRSPAAPLKRMGRMKRTGEGSVDCPQRYNPKRICNDGHGRGFIQKGHVWTPPPVQEESLDSCGAGSGAAMCPASAAAAHRPRARMGVRGSGPHHRSALEALSLRLVLLIPPHRRLRHTCPSTSSHRRQPHARRPLMRRRPELDNFRPWRSTPTRSAPSCWPALR